MATSKKKKTRKSTQRMAKAPKATETKRRTARATPLRGKNSAPKTQRTKTMRNRPEVERLNRELIQAKKDRKALQQKLTGLEQRLAKLGGEGR
jgi:hypothetical protein